MLHSSVADYKIKSSRIIAKILLLNVLCLLERVSFFLKLIVFSQQQPRKNLNNELVGGNYVVEDVKMLRYAAEK